MSLKLAVALFFAVTTVAHCANILDYFDFEDGKKLIEVAEKREDQNDRSCACKGPACVCCVNFNITFIDLGGPGCVHMKYLSPEDGFSVNVSYGKNLIHSAKIQGTNPAPICLEVIGKFAQVCAKFSDMAPTADGLRGCLELEPRIFGDKQLEFPIGCFRSKSGGMEMEDPPEETESTTQDGEDSTEEETPAFNAESFLMEIYQTAEQGVAFLSSLLDLPNKLNGTKPVVPETTTVKTQEEGADNSQTRGPKSLKHPNQL
ncbi:unnamed protein product [Chilo suppressalis]|uniref:DUF4773 domain-containing protein n=1 Tax=Chilo suppressalis TaxID=168631 RepID=A0ABN8BBE0_CHISP|nr:unnamed protein product [Chilo suppressalis]